MTFKIKSGLQVGSTTVVDQNSYFQQIESAAEIPPSLNFNFLSGTLDSRITYTRPSNGTFVAANGLIANSVAGVPRFEYSSSNNQPRGYLSENQSTNLLLWSANTRGGGWFADQAFLDSSTITAPDGSQTASKLTEGTSSVGYRIIRQDLTLSTSTPYTASIFCKAGEIANVGLSWFDGVSPTTYAFADFNLTTGAIVQQGQVVAGVANNGLANATIIPYANGWYRCCLSFTTQTNGSSSIRLGLGSFASPGGNVNGTLVWGGQLEYGYVPTSFIYTTTAAVTRSTDSAEITGTTFHNTINKQEGTFVVEMECNSTATGGQQVGVNMYPTVFTVANNTAAFTNILWYGSIAETYVNLTYNNIGGVAAGPRKVALAYANATGQSVTGLDGVIVSRNGRGLDSSASRLGIGNLGNPLGGLNGTIRSFQYYPKQLSNTTITNLTTL